MDEHNGTSFPEAATADVRQRDLEEPARLARWLFGEFPRADQRRWAGAYLRGLLTTTGKKSVRRMGSTVSTSHTAWQSLHQVVNASTWRWEPVRRQLADWCVRDTPARALVLAPAVIPKRGQQSAGVHRRFDPVTGRTAGCQWALGLFLATGHAALPVDWRLHLPDRWSEDERLRERACIPETEGFRTPATLATDLVDSRIARARPSLPVVAQAATADEAGALAASLAARGRDFVLAVPATTPLTADRPPVTHHRRTPVSATSAPRHPKHRGHPATAAPLSTVPPPPPGPLAAPAHVRLPGCPHPLRLVPVRSRAGGPTRTWLTSMTGPRLPEAAGLVALNGAVAHAAETMADCGLHDFEGRSFPGWHRHMTLVSAASTLRLLESAYTNGAVRAAA